MVTAKKRSFSGFINVHKKKMFSSVTVQHPLNCMVGQLAAGLIIFQLQTILLSSLTSPEETSQIANHKLLSIFKQLSFKPHWHLES